MAEINHISAYMAGTLKVLLDAANSILDRESINYSNIIYEDRLEQVGGADFVERSKDTLGRVDETALLKNCGLVAYCGAFMKDRLINEFRNAKINRVQYEDTVKRSDGKLVNLCYFVVDRLDKERAQEIITRLNSLESIRQADAKEFAAECQSKNIPMSCMSIEEEKLDYMERMGDMNFRYCTVPDGFGNLHLYMAKADSEKAHDAVRKASLICSAETRRHMMGINKERDRIMEKALALIGDTHTACRVYDKDEPSHYLRTDSNGIYYGIGKHEEPISRMSQGWEGRVYGILKGYGTIEIDSERKPEKIKENIEQERQRSTPYKKELDLMEKTERYKRELVEQINFRYANEQQLKDMDAISRMKDDDYRFGNAINKALREGDGELLNDLYGDKSANQRAINGVIGERSVDLSDLNGQDFIKDFCLYTLGYRVMTDEVARLSMIEEAYHTPAFHDLAVEPPEVKIAIINEIEDSIREVQNISYTLNEVSPQELIQDIEKDDRIQMEINEQEYERTDDVDQER